VEEGVAAVIIVRLKAQGSALPTQCLMKPGLKDRERQRLPEPSCYPPSSKETGRRGCESTSHRGPGARDRLHNDVGG